MKSEREREKLAIRSPILKTMIFNISLTFAPTRREKAVTTLKRNAGWSFGHT